MDNIKRAEKISLFVFDVDGTLTDGKIYISSEGEAMKAFHAQDGMAMSVAKRLGYDIILISGRKSKILEMRAQELGVIELYQNIERKLELLQDICKKKAISLEQVAYAGDDLNDVPMFEKVGLAWAPADACTDVQKLAHFVSNKGGGQGAVRELVEFVLGVQGRWVDALNFFKKGE